MKTILRLAILMVVILVVGICTACFGADPTTATVPAATATPALTDWIMSNKAAIFGLCLAISEFLSLIPGFKGNGILDTIIKALKLLTGKDTTQAS